MQTYIRYPNYNYSLFNIINLSVDDFIFSDFYQLLLHKDVYIINFNVHVYI